jgi:hypothetical protein
VFAELAEEPRLTAEVLAALRDELLVLVEHTQRQELAGYRLP